MVQEVPHRRALIHTIDAGDYKSGILSSVGCLLQRRSLLSCLSYRSEWTLYGLKLLMQPRDDRVVVAKYHRPIGAVHGGVRLYLPPFVLLAADLVLEAGEADGAIIGCEHLPAHFFLKSKAISLASQAEKLTVSPALIPAASRVGRSPGRSRYV